MLYLGGVTLGYFHLYPPGFQPKERTDGDGAPAAAAKADASRPLRESPSSAN